MYFIATTLLCIMIAFMMYKVTSLNLKDTNERISSDIKRNGIILIISFFLITAPFFNTVFQANSESVSTQTNDISVWLLLIGGIVLLVGCVVEFSIQKRNHTLNKIGTIITIQIYLWVGLYATYAAIDHLSFADKNFGVMSTKLIEMGQVDDVVCNKPLVFVNFTEGERKPIKWRCPEYFVLNGLSSKPFVPWPNYSEGESQKMADFLNQVVIDAKNNTLKNSQ